VAGERERVASVIMQRLAQPLLVHARQPPRGVGHPAVAAPPQPPLVTPGRRDLHVREHIGELE